MRDRVLKIGLMLSILAVPLLAWGQTPAAGTPGGKIGVINIQQTIALTAEGKSALADLQKKFAPRQAELQKQQQEIQTLSDQLQRQASTLSEAEQIRLRRDLAEKQKLAERAQEDFQGDVQDDRQDIINRIGQKMVQIIDDYAKQNGYSLIMDAQIPFYAGNQASSAQIPIYYASQDVDISAEVIKRYDAAFPIASAGTPGGTAAPGSKPAAPQPEKPKP